MENGFGNLADKFSELGVTGSSSPTFNPDNDSLFQVKKAVELAEATIKQQVEENNQLRSQLYKQTQWLEKYKSGESSTRGPLSVDPWKECVCQPFEAQQAIPSICNQDDRARSINNISLVAAQDTVIHPRDATSNSWDSAMQTRPQKNPESIKANGNLNVDRGSQALTDTAVISQFSLPSTSYSPSRNQMEGEYDDEFNFSGNASIPMTEVNNSSSLLKQDLVVKIQQHEEEMMLLRKHLAEYSIKEAHVQNEKYVLEKRIAHMRLAFDQQQQDLVDAASKALSYRQDIIEENVRLTYALQDAQQERATFVSSLLPLLAEYSLQPSVRDAQSIVSNIKVLFKHLQEKLIFTEAKLKESQYQLAPWHSDANPSNLPQSPAHLTAADWDITGRQQTLRGPLTNNMETDDTGGYSPLAIRNAAAQDVHMQLAISHRDALGTLYGEETTSKQVTFNDLVSSSEIDQRVAERYQNERENSVNWVSGSSTYTTTPDDPRSSYSPYILPPVLEEPSSSYSEAADDDPLPAIDGLQITGEAFPGQELLACGISINGTTNCNFEWVRHWEDGSVNYIEGAKQPNYLVTADDVDAYLAIEVQPLDNRKRKGKPVKVFANEHRKITCYSEMHAHIERTLLNGHASYKLSLSTGYLDIWEPATLAIKREGFSIKRSGPSGVIVAEKFLPTTTVMIPYFQATEFVITGSSGVENLLRTDESLTDTSCSRDTIVLTLRLFIIRAGEKRKGKKKSLFFNK